MVLFVYKLLKKKKTKLFCTSQQKRRSQPPTPPARATWSRAAALGWVKARKQELDKLCSYPTFLTTRESCPATCCNAEPKAQPNQRFCCTSVSVKRKILRFTATMRLNAYLSNAGITVILQNSPGEEIISDLTIRFALYAVLKT